MFTVPEKFKHKPSRKRVKEGRHYRHSSTKFTANALVTRTLNYDIGICHYSPSSNAATETKAFGGYLFLRPENYPNSTSTKWKWNDGCFWYYGSNFFELPITTVDSTGSSLIGGDNPVNFLRNNRRLYGGTRMNYEATTERFQVTSNISDATGWSSPYVTMTDTDLVHQFSQSIDLREQMVYVDKAIGSSGVQDGALVMYPGPSIGPLKELNAAGVDYSNAFQTLVQDKLKKHLKFKVRNVICLFPHDFYEDTSEEYDLSGYNNPLVGIEKTMLQEFFQTSDKGFGAGDGTNKDLYRRTNPKFKVMRDWIQTYTFGSDHSPQVVKTKFYHRYNDRVPTKCSIVTQDPGHQTTSVIDDDDTVQLRTGVTSETIQSTTVTSVNDDYMNLEGDNHPRDFNPEITDNEPATKRVKLADGSTAANIQNAAEDGDEVGIRAQNGSQDFVYNPKTHRVVWLRFPRFASTFELHNLNNGDYNCTAFVDTDSFGHIVSKCGLRIKGTNEWKFVKPGMAGTGGRLKSMEAINSNGSSIRIGPDFS